VTDHGLINAFAMAGASDQRVRSRAFEAVVFRHLRDLARQHDGEISYFRQKDDLEIDFVLELPGRRVAVEATSSGAVRERKVLSDDDLWYRTNA